MKKNYSQPQTKAIKIQFGRLLYDASQLKGNMVTDPGIRRNSSSRSTRWSDDDYFDDEFDD